MFSRQLRKTMDPATEQIWYARSVLDDLPPWMDGRDAIRLAIRVCDGAVQLHDAVRYIWVYARKQGWYIPSYPMDPAGEVRDFLADAGVHDVPEWYRAIGVDASVYAHLADFRLLVAVDPWFHRCAQILPALAFDDAAPVDTATQVLLHASACKALDFVLGRGGAPAPLFD